jgi:hypothetical protein
MAVPHPRRGRSSTSHERPKSLDEAEVRRFGRSLNGEGSRLVASFRHQQNEVGPPRLWRGVIGPFGGGDELYVEEVR